jgi:uncharacterized membrane protein
MAVTGPHERGLLALVRGAILIHVSETEPPQPQTGHLDAQLRDQLSRLERQLSPLVGLAERAGLSAGHEIAHEVSRLGPAWRRATAGELRWPVSGVVAAMIAMQIAVPHRLSLTGNWLIPALETVLLVILVASNPARITNRSPVLRALGLALIASASLANAYSAGSLVAGLVKGTEGTDAGALLATGGNIWLTNIIIFGLWYWELDRGGPASRALALRTRPSFLFPEMTEPQLAGPEWVPLFFDYLYVAFTNAAAFSPTDTMPFSRWAKLVMMLQSAISLVTAALVIARAVNILK